MWARKVGADHMQTVLQRFDQGATKALAAVQRQIAVGALVKVGELPRAEGVFDDFDARMLRYPRQGVGAHVLPTADF